MSCPAAKPTAGSAWCDPTGRAALSSTARLADQVFPPSLVRLKTIRESRLRVPFGPLLANPRSAQAITAWPVPSTVMVGIELVRNVVRVPAWSKGSMGDATAFGFPNDLPPSVEDITQMACGFPSLVLPECGR